MEILSNPFAQIVHYARLADSGFVFLLLVVEKYFPYRKFSKEDLKASFATNTGAFLVNNVIMSIFSLSSLLIVASNYAQYGLLGSGERQGEEEENQGQPGFHDCRRGFVGVRTGLKK